MERGGEVVGGGRSADGLSQYGGAEQAPSAPSSTGSPRHVFVDLLFGLPWRRMLAR